MPPLSASTPEAPDGPPVVFGLFSLNWTVPDSQSPSRRRPLHRIQVGVDLSNVDLQATRTWFRRSAQDPVATAVRRWCWGHAAQSAIANAIAEAWTDVVDQDLPAEASPLTATMLRERFTLASQTLRERLLDPMAPQGPWLGDVQVDLPASALLGVGRPADLVFYDPAFNVAMERAAEAVRDELTDALTQHLDRSRVVFAEHHNDPSDVGAIQRLLIRWQDPGAQPIVAPTSPVVVDPMVQDAAAVRQAAQDAFAEPVAVARPRAPGR